MERKALRRAVRQVAQRAEEAARRAERSAAWPVEAAQRAAPVGAAANSMEQA